MGKAITKAEKKQYLPNKKSRVDIPLDSRSSKIIDHYVNGTELTPKLEEERARLYEIWVSLVNGNSPEIVKAAYMEKHGVSLRTVQRDLNDAMAVHGDIQPINKNAQRHLLAEMCLFTYNSAKADGNFQEMNRAIKNMMDLYGLTKDDPDKVDWDLLEQHEIRIRIPKDMMEAMKQSLSKGAVDLDEAIDIPHEELD